MFFVAADDQPLRRESTQEKDTEEVCSVLSVCVNTHQPNSTCAVPFSLCYFVIMFPSVTVARVLSPSQECLAYSNVYSDEEVLSAPNHSQILIGDLESSSEGSEDNDERLEVIKYVDASGVTVWMLVV